MVKKKIDLDSKFDNSAPFDLTLWSDHPQIEEATNWIFDKLVCLPTFKKGQKTKRLKHIKVILLDLYSKWMADPTMYSGYHRGSNWFSELTHRSNPNQISRMLIIIIDGMVDLGFIENQSGFYDRLTPKRSKISRMKATETLISQVFQDFGFQLLMVEKSPKSECIILKDKDPITEDQIEIPYDDTPETIQMRKNLIAYNNLLRKTFIDIKNFPEEGIFSDGKSVKKVINRSNKFVRRIFNNGSWELGSRFYGGWWQNLPKEWRLKIRIGGDRPVAELDYSGIHIIILYAIKRMFRQ